MELRPYQIAAGNRLAEGSAVGLWMAAGLGKTATALHAWDLIGRPEPVLVVTRAIGRHVWPRDSRALFGDDTFGVLWAGKKQSKTGMHKNGTFSCLDAALSQHSGVVTNYEILGKRITELLQVPWQLLIFDEAHSLKMGYKPLKRRKNGSYVDNQYSYARKLADSVRRRGPVWEITATPVRDRIRDYWGQVNVVLPKKYPERSYKKYVRGRYKWLCHFCGAFINEWGGLDTSGATNTDELRAALLEDFVFLDRNTVADQLPAIQRDVREVETKKKRNFSAKSYEDAITFAASLKHEAVQDLVLEYLSAGHKCVVTTTRRKLAAQITADLHKQVFGKSGSLFKDLVSHVQLVTVTGETPVQRRMQIVNAFNEYNGPGVLVATTDSISESINLHLVDGLIVAGLPYTPAQIIQLEGRVGRLGGKPCTIHYLVASDTIDEKIRLMLLDKLDAVSSTGSDTQGGSNASHSLREMRDESAIIDALVSWLENPATAA